MPEAPRKVTLPTAILTSAPEDRAARGSGHSLPFLRPLSGSGEEGARGRRAPATRPPPPCTWGVWAVAAGARAGAARPPTAGGLVPRGHLPARGLCRLISAAPRNRGDRPETPRVRTPSDAHGAATCLGPAEAPGLPRGTDAQTRHFCSEAGTDAPEVAPDGLVCGPTLDSGFTADIARRPSGRPGARPGPAGRGCGPWS